MPKAPLSLSGECSDPPVLFQIPSVIMDLALSSLTAQVATAGVIYQRMPSEQMQQNSQKSVLLGAEELLEKTHLWEESHAHELDWSPSLEGGG